MHIIFGEAAQTVPDSYTVLELDTVRRPPENIPVTAYCLVERIPLQEFPVTERLKELHDNVIKYYKQQEWDYCEQAITDSLRGKWGGELDSFYDNLLERVRTYKQNPPPEGWDGSLEKPGK
jgi:adenylate cyclase